MKREVYSISYFLRDSSGNYMSAAWVKKDTWEWKLIVNVVRFILFIRRANENCRIYYN
jgi:hypothetical protein